MSSFVVDLREASSSWRHENDVLEVNGEGFTASEAIKLVNQYPSAHHFVQQMIDACLIKQTMRSGAYESSSFEAFKASIIEARFDTWWASNRGGLTKITCAWISLTPSAEVPLRILVGNLASNPSAAVVSARCEGRDGGFIDTRVNHLASQFAPLRHSEIGAVIPLQLQSASIGIALDRADPVLDETVKQEVAPLVFDEWLSDQRNAARVRWLWNSDSVAGHR